MPTRSQVLASLIQRYDAQITGTESAAIEPAVIKLLIAQLVDNVVSGPGGGSISGLATEAKQDTTNTSLTSIDSSSTQLLTALNAVLAELRDDSFTNESVWFDRTNPLDFYIRRFTFDQNTQTPVLAWYDKSGVAASPVISRLVQGNATSALQQENIDQILALNTILQAIETKVTTPDTRPLTAATDSVAVGSLPGTVAADIAAIKTNTAKISQYSFQLAEDSAGTVFLVRTDTVTGASTNISVATGLAFTPVGAIELTDPATAQVIVEQNEYECITTNAGNWTIGDIIERIRTINTSTGAVISTDYWYNAAGVQLTVIPVIGTDVVDSDRQSLTAIKSIDAKIPTVAQKTSALSSPVVLASDQSDINPNRTLTTASFNKITDGTSTVAIKAASVSPVAADPSLVVTLSPNTDFATATLQTSGNTSLSTIATNLPAKGQALAASSMPVVLPTAQITALTPPAAITGFALDTTVDGLLKPASTLTAVTTVGAVTAITNALPVGTNTIGNVNQTLATAGFGKISDGTNTVSVKAASTAPLAADPALVVALSPNTSFATSTLQTSGNTSLSTIATNLPVKGQALAADSMPVVLPATQITALTPPAAITGFALDTTVDSLLKPASTLTAVTTLGSITNALPAGTNTIGNVNQSLATAGFSKISDGTSTVSIKAASTAPVAADAALVVALSPNTNFATSTLQTSGNTSLSTIASNTPALGQALEAASSPVVLPATQIAALTPPAAITGFALDTSVNNLLKPASTLAGVTALGSITNALPTGSNTIGNVNQTAATAGFDRITDGTNTATVKAASTAAATADTALVVAINPQTVLNTGLTTAAALADATANPTTRIVGSAALGYNGTTWDRLRSGSTGVATTVTGFLNTLPLGRYSLTTPTLADGNVHNLRLTSSGALIIDPAVTTTARSGGVNPGADLALTANARVRSILFTNNTASSFYLQIHSSAVALTATSIPLNGLIYRVPGNSTLTIPVSDLGEKGTLFAANTRIAISTTFGIFTSPGAIVTNTSLSVETV